MSFNFGKPQEPTIGPKVVWSPLPGSQTLAMSCPAHVILYHGSRGPGKDIAVDTPVLTDSGWKRAGDVTYADKLVALDGTYTNIDGIFPKKDRPLYNVEFYDGAIVEADEEHRWRVLNNKTGYREGWKVRTTKQIMSVSVGYSIPYLEGPIGGAQWHGPDPYMLGYIIANGTTGSQYTTIYSIDDEILEYARDKHGWAIYAYETVTARRAVCRAADDAVWRNVLDHKLADCKYVPRELLEADAATRLALLQGLMDGDGNAESGAKSRYSTVSKQLADDIVYLVKSLGGWATANWRDMSKDTARYGGRGWIYRVNISHHNKFNPFRLKRKAERYCEQKKHLTRGIKSITYSRQGDGVCFAVAHPSHCFVVGDFVISHNTDAQLMRFRRWVGQGFGKHWRGVIFDREYKNLDDLVAKSTRWFPEFKDGARFLSSKSDYRWVWPTGEELMFRVVKKASDYWSYHGQEFCLAVGELVCTPTGDVPIESLRVGDLVLTPEGPRKVTRVFQPFEKSCLDVLVYDKIGNFIGKQRQSADHMLLSADRRSFGQSTCIALVSPDELRKNARVTDANTYVHPYTGVERCASTPFQVGRAVFVGCGNHKTIDITIEDTNCYITPTGAISKNCYIGWNELTKFPTDELFDAMMSCNRSSFRPQDYHSGVFDSSTGEEIPLPKIPLEVFATCNPFGPGHSWIKKRFINAAPMGKIWSQSINVFNPQTQKKEDIAKTQVHLFGSYRENKYLSPEYVAELEKMTDLNKRKAWLMGDWDVVAGGMFDDVWDSQQHVVKPFLVPPTWRIDRSFDYGSSRPFSVGWWAESDGCEIVVDGKVQSTVRGDIYRIAEWYGTSGKTNQGTRMLANDIAAGIVERELRLGIHKRVVPGPADNSIWDSDNGNSIAAEMARKVTVSFEGATKAYMGVSWTRSDKSSGSRRDGWEGTRKYLKNAMRPEGGGPREKPGMFFFNSCPYTIDLFPVLPRDETDPDDVDTDSEDHIGDEIRYKVLSMMLRTKVGRTKGTA